MNKQGELWNSYTKEEQEYIRADYHRAVYDSKHDCFAIDIFKVKWMEDLFGPHNLNS